jgi:glycosyltransferase involved in cell wall biosynthesis
MSAPKISVLIATFNAEKTLAACLDSILTQNYSNIEILIADGVSKDRTLEIIDEYKKKSRFIAYTSSEPDKGIYDAWNKIVPKASGDWLIFLGADDELWKPETFSLAAPHLTKAFPEVRVVYGKVALLLPNGEILKIEGEPWEKAAKMYRHEMTIPHQGTFQHRSLFEKYGLFNPSFKVCGDYEFLMRELKDHPARFIPDLVIAKMGFGGVSSTLTNTLRIIDELDLARNLNGIHTPSPYILARRLRAHTRGHLQKIFGKNFADNLADVYRVLVGKPKLWGRIRKTKK